MKTFISIFSLIFVILLCTNSNLMAQGKTGAIEWGLKAGLNLATASGDDAEFKDEETGETLNPETRMGFIGGVFMTYYISDMFAFQPELLYSQKGVIYNFSTDIMGLNTEINTTGRYDYLDIPLLAKFNFPVQNVGSFNLHLGPSAGIKLLSETDFEMKFSGLGEESFDTTSTVVNEEAKDFVVNLVFGAGFGFDTDFGTISIEGRYNMGMMGPDGKAEGEAEEPKVRLNAISILASIAFK